MTTKPPRRRLVAVDSLTGRTFGLDLSFGAETANPALFGALVAEAAWTIGREWVRRYGVPFHWHRINWRIETEDPETVARQLAETLAAASAVHD